MTSQEILTLAEKTFWTGGPGDNTGCNFGILPETDSSYIDEIKRLTAKKTRQVKMKKGETSVVDSF